MDSLMVLDTVVKTQFSSATIITSTSVRHQLPCFLSPPIRGPPPSLNSSLCKGFIINLHRRKISAVAGSGAVMTNSVPVSSSPLISVTNLCSGFNLDKQKYFL